MARARADDPVRQPPDLRARGSRGARPVQRDLGLIGREHGLHPRDNWAAAQHEALLSAVEELRGHVVPTLRITDPAEKQRAREQLAADYLPRWGACVDAVLTAMGPGPFVAGDAIHVADIKLYMAARWFSSGTLDHIRTDVFAEFPRLTGVERAVADHPKIRDWYARG